MLTFAQFMNGLDAQQGDVPTSRGHSSDAAMQQSAEAMMPTFALWAERAGLELDDITTEIRERTPMATGIVMRRIANLADDAVSDDVERELHHLACAVALQFFCAGVLWEQQRQLPDLGASFA